LRDVGKEVESALGIDTGDAGDAIQFFMSVTAPFGVFGQPAFQVILRPGQGGDRSFLGEGSWIAGAMALDGINGLGNGLRSGQIAEAPASHGISLGKPVNDYGMLVMGLGKAGHTR